MKTALILLSMIFFHIVDDFYLQGSLASFKQKSWWKKNCPNRMYRYDYLVALLFHAFSWTFMIHLPLVAACLLSKKEADVYVFLLLFAVNIIIHAVTDDCKANKLSINLITDQIIHLLQITGTYLFYMYVIL